MLKWSVIYIGTTLNLLVISAPLVVVDINIDEYFSNPVIWAFYLLIAMVCLFEGGASFYLDNENPHNVEKVFLPYLVGICVLLIFWISIYEYTNYFQIDLIQSVIGSLLIVFGVTVRLISILKLNKYFLSHVGLVDNHQLITTGIYSLIRHPSELGLLSICLGVVIFLSSIMGLCLIAFVLLPLTIYRIILEDRLLQSLFTAEYNDYKARTPGLFPKLIVRNTNKAS